MEANLEIERIKAQAQAEIEKNKGISLTAQKAKSEITLFWVTGIMRIGIQKAAFKIHLQNTVHSHSRISFSQNQ